jgi:putative oxidoreductase
VQRLFSTFPNDWPGCGLLVLRLTIAVPLLASSFSFLADLTPHSSAVVVKLAALAVGALLLVGFCTPYSAFMQILLELWWISHEPSIPGGHAVLAAIGASLIMLGPGAWSVDARLFGRTKFEWPDE